MRALKAAHLPRPLSERVAVNDREAFHAAIDAAPNDDAPVLVYADWLQERGEEDEAHRLRSRIYARRAWLNFASAMNAASVQWSQGMVKAFAGVAKQMGKPLAPLAESFLQLAEAVERNPELRARIEAATAKADETSDA